MRARHLLSFTIATIYSLSTQAQSDSSANSLKSSDKINPSEQIKYYNSKGWTNFYTDSLPTATSFLAKFKWRLIQLHGRPVAVYKAFLTFDNKNNQVNGSTGCNNFWGPFSINDNNIQFAPLAATMKACNGDNIENDVFSVLESKDLRFDIAEQTLNFYIKNKLVMIFGIDK